jgi:hypothetical protein
MDLENERTTIKAFSASCPYCQTIIGFIRDPQPMDIDQ